MRESSEVAALKTSTDSALDIVKEQNCQSAMAQSYYLGFADSPQKNFVSREEKAGLER